MGVTPEELAHAIRSMAPSYKETIRRIHWKIAYHRTRGSSVRGIQRFRDALGYAEQHPEELQ